MPSHAVAPQPVSDGQVAAVQQTLPRQRVEAHIVPSVQALPPAPPPVVVPPVVVPPVEVVVVVPPVEVVVDAPPVVAWPVVPPVEVVVVVPPVVVPPSPLSVELQATANTPTNPNPIKHVRMRRPPW